MVNQPHFKARVGDGQIIASFFCCTLSFAEVPKLIDVDNNPNRADGFNLF